MGNKRTRPLMEWHLYELMAKNKIRTATELQRRLKDIGVEISSAQLARLMNSNPRRVSSELMFGLTNIFRCTAFDLWTNPNKPEIKAEETQSSVQERAARRHGGQGYKPTKADIVGPVATPFPKPEKK